MTKEIQLTNGYKAIVDDEDFDELSKFKWHVAPGYNTNYASYTNYDNYKKTIAMHRMVMGFPEKLQIDHINGNGLDNRKSNLRICTRSQNKMNTKKNKIKKFKYKGVAINKNNKHPFYGQLRFGKVRYYLGCFSTPEEAALAYDKKAKELFGEFACLNFPTK
jgi:beta-glucanase (GH16 family)